jgi:hypothetical protein
MKTIDIERTTNDYTVKRKQHGAFRDTDMRGKQPSKNKIEKETIEVVHRHIRSFPKMESHYSRKKRKKTLPCPRSEYQTYVVLVCRGM